MNKALSFPSIIISNVKSADDKHKDGDGDDDIIGSGDDPNTPPATPYGTPHTSSHLYRANIDSICDKLGQLGKMK